MKVLIIVSAFLSVQVYGNVINAKCDPQQFSTCTDAFAKSLGLPYMPTDADVLNNQIKSLEAKGKQGQQQVCQAYATFKSCFGSQYDDCISVAFLKSIGESDKDAKEFVAISQQLQQMCVQIRRNVQQCDGTLFTTCTDTFAKALGLPYMPTDATVLDKQIKSLEAKGKQGQQQVCIAAGTLQSCLGAQYAVCISVAYLTSIGESVADAQEFVAISKQLEQQCAQVRSNAQCDSQTFYTCTDTFAKALGLSAMPTNADILKNQIKSLEVKGKQGLQQVCQAAGDLQNCFGSQYDACISVAYLKSIGESDKDANDFVAISQELQQTCTQVKAINAQCDAQTFFTCTDTFAKALGLSAMPTDADILNNQIKSLEAKGKQGQQQVCQAAGDLQNCFGSQYDACISVAYLKSIGESDKDAKEFVAIAQQLQQTCTQVRAINVQCESQLFGTCTDTFAKALGLPSMPTDARVLLLQVMTVEAKGQQGAIQVCTAEASLQSCLGAEYDDCLSVAFLKSIGESDADAQAFVKLSDLLKQTCVH